MAQEYPDPDLALGPYLVACVVGVAWHAEEREVAEVVHHDEEVAVVEVVHGNAVEVHEVADVGSWDEDEGEAEKEAEGRDQTGMVQLVEEQTEHDPSPVPCPSHDLYHAGMVGDRVVPTGMEAHVDEHEGHADADADHGDHEERVEDGMEEEEGHHHRHLLSLESSHDVEDEAA